MMKIVADTERLVIGGLPLVDEIPEKTYWNQRSRTNKGKLLWVLLGIFLLVEVLIATMMA